MLLVTSQTMLELNLLKKPNPLPINCQPTATSSNKMLYRNSNPSLKSREKEQLVNKSSPFWVIYKLNWKPHSQLFKNKKSMLLSLLPNTFQILMLKLLG